jgi:pimeloyl-ACP methyl ester carboxylesterase
MEFGESMKTALILTGKHEITDERYQGIVKAFKDAGWNQAILYEPDWRRHTVKELIDDFLSFIPTDSEPLTLLGFSLGAMIALIASDTLDVDNLALCSPSGYFKEYAPLLTGDDLDYARKDLSDFESYSAIEAISKSKAKRGNIIAGENELAEWPDFKKWVSDLRFQTGWDYTELSGVSHEIEAPGYQEAIKSMIQNWGQ